VGSRGPCQVPGRSEGRALGQGRGIGESLQADRDVERKSRSSQPCSLPPCHSRSLMSILCHHRPPSTHHLSRCNNAGRISVLAHQWRHPPRPGPSSSQGTITNGLNPPLERLRVQQASNERPTPTNRAVDRETHPKPNRSLEAPLFMAGPLHAEATEPRVHVAPHAEATPHWAPSGLAGLLRAEPRHMGLMGVHGAHGSSGEATRVRKGACDHHSIRTWTMNTRRASSSSPGRAEAARAAGRFAP
jgi:hypothetical protein